MVRSFITPFLFYVVVFFLWMVVHLLNNWGRPFRSFDLSRESKDQNGRSQNLNADPMWSRDVA